MDKQSDRRNVGSSVSMSNEIMEDMGLDREELILDPQTTKNQQRLAAKSTMNRETNNERINEFDIIDESPYVIDNNHKTMMVIDEKNRKPRKIVAGNGNENEKNKVKIKNRSDVKADNVVKTTTRVTSSTATNDVAMRKQAENVVKTKTTTTSLPPQQQTKKTTTSTLKSTSETNKKNKSSTSATVIPNPINLEPSSPVIQPPSFRGISPKDNKKYDSFGMDKTLNELLENMDLS